MNIQGERHIFKRFDKEMQYLHDLVVQMGGLAVNQLEDALDTLKTENPEKAYEVISNDRKLNDLDSQADDEIIRLIALRQPVARDLRKLISVGKIVAELERAGDEARKIASLTIRFFREGKTPPSEEILRDIYSLSAYVINMLEMAIQAFDDLNLDLAADVLVESAQLDDQLKSILRRLSTFIMEDSRNVGHFVDIVLGIRALERFGGHSSNIAGHIVFIEKGIDVRHASDESILRNLRDEYIKDFDSSLRNEARVHSSGEEDQEQ